jgi:hypothetical protein
MKKARKILLIFISVMIWLAACSQTGTGNAISAHYKGSSPCNSLIKSMIGVPQSPICDFIIWDLMISKGPKDSTFQVKMVYGESKPSTPGFKEDHHIDFNGTFMIHIGVPSNPRAKQYHFKSSSGKKEFWLSEMNGNIFLFTDAWGKNLVGNAGYSYVLNRVRD